MFPAPITRHSGVQRHVHKAVLEIQLLQKSLHSDSLLACWFGVRTRMCVRYFIFSTPVRAGPRAHPVLCKMDSGSHSQRSSGRDVALTSLPDLAQRLKKEWSYTSTPPSHAFMICYRDNCTSPFEHYTCFGRNATTKYLVTLTLRRLMSYIYMEHPFLMFLDHTQRRSTVGRSPLVE